MARPVALLTTTLLLSAPLSMAADEFAKQGTTKAPRSRIMIMLETNIVPGKKLKGPPAEYKPDKDPNTIELVELPSSDTGPSRVSEDGQVIFVRDMRMTQKETKQLMDKAFDILVEREGGAK
jgi:hypothetical protein